jgi:hypothetical protein
MQGKKPSKFQDPFDAWCHMLCTGPSKVQTKAARLGLLYAGACYGVYVPDEVVRSYNTALIDLIEGVTGKKRKGSVEGGPAKKKATGNGAAGRGKKREQRDKALVDASVGRVKV